MKTIGLLGGMSWESSIVYEQIINQEVRRRLGGLHSADLLIRSYDFAVVERLQVAGRGNRRDACWPPTRGGWKAPARTCWCCAPTPCTRCMTPSPRR